MNLTVNTILLKNALQPFKKVINSKTNFILTGIKLIADFEQQTLTIEGTNLELSLKAILPANVLSSGIVVVPFKNIENLANINNEERTTINLIENKTTRTAYKSVKTGYLLKIENRSTQSIKAETEQEAIQKAIDDGIIDPEVDRYSLEDYFSDEPYEEEFIEYILQIYKLKLNTFSIEEFPKFPELKQEGIRTSNNLNFKDFQNCLSKVIDFTSKDKSRVILTGILFDTANNCIVATDSYKMAVQKFDFGKDLEEKIEEGLKTFVIDFSYRSFTVGAKDENEAKQRFFKDYASQGWSEKDIVSIGLQSEKYEPEPKKIVLPSEVYELLKLLKAFDFDVAVDRDNSQIEFTVGNYTIISRLLYGKYPDYEKLIPVNFNYVFRLDSQKIISILDEADKLLNVAKDNIPVKIRHEKEHELKFFCNIREVGEYESFVDMEVIKMVQEEHEPLLFAVNPGFFKLCLKNFEHPVLQIAGELKPMLLQEDEDFKAVLMPIRIS